MWLKRKEKLTLVANIITAREYIWSNAIDFHSQFSCDCEHRIVDNKVSVYVFSRFLIMAQISAYTPPVNDYSNVTQADIQCATQV